jgi:hypothetical protein
LVDPPSDEGNDDSNSQYDQVPERGRKGQDEVLDDDYGPNDDSVGQCQRTAQSEGRCGPDEHKEERLQDRGNEQ